MGTNVNRDQPCEPPCRQNGECTFGNTPRTYLCLRTSAGNRGGAAPGPAANSVGRSWHESNRANRLPNLNCLKQSYHQSGTKADRQYLSDRPEGVTQHCTDNQPLGSVFDSLRS